MRRAIGLMAGPLSPPKTFPSLGRRVSTSTAMARNVLTRETASAPASSAAWAISTMLVTLGESLVMRGRRLAALIRLHEVEGRSRREGRAQALLS